MRFNTFAKNRGIHPSSSTTLSLKNQTPVSPYCSRKAKSRLFRWSCKDLGNKIVRKTVRRGLEGTVHLASIFMCSKLGEPWCALNPPHFRQIVIFVQLFAVQTPPV